jgi:hypothetical protein
MVFAEAAGFEYHLAMLTQFKETYDVKVYLLPNASWWVINT